MLFRKEKKRERDRAVIIVVISDEIFKECTCYKPKLSFFDCNGSCKKCIGFLLLSRTGFERVLLFVMTNLINKVSIEFINRYFFKQN